MTTPQLTYIVPVHNEAATLASTIQRLDDARARYAIQHIVAVENGSVDDTWPLLEELAPRYPALLAFREPSAGIGYAYHRGLSEALALDLTGEHYLVLTACDLPFGFTDVESMLALPERPPVCIGSKAKLVGSTVPSLKRRTMSAAYQLARRWLIGMHTRDSQGSFIIRADIAREFVDRVQARDFFYTTELCALMERDRIRPVEVDVELQEERRRSSVRPLAHGAALFRQLLQLRRRLRGSHAA
ncbi:MAG TPA: glycosyltransferase family 2 protein [Kofleriaceae bacterium]